jgi:hypothetical protein
MRDLMAPSENITQTRRRLAIAFSDRVRRESVLANSTYQYSSGDYGGAFQQLWIKPDPNDVVLFDKIEERYHQRKL